jgi:CRP/FNR family transcriptional regulator, cyclic AMP receptor protein
VDRTEEETAPVGPTQLSRAVLFADLPETELAPVAARTRARRYSAGEPILRRGGPAEHLFVLDHGRVEVDVHDTGGGSSALRQLMPGDSFGEVALLDGLPRSADVVAVTDCRVLVVERDEFLRFVQLRPRVAERLHTILRQQVRQDEELAPDQALGDVAGSLTRAIHILAQEEGRAEPLVEILPVTLREGGIWWIRPTGASSWQVGSDVTLYPGELVTQELGRFGLAPRAVHSTSWRYEQDHLVLTYAALLPDDTTAGEGLVAAPVEREELARGSATGPPDEIHVAQVVEHALRHLSWLSRDDPVLMKLLEGAWARALESYEPEPFRALSSDELATG